MNYQRSLEWVYQNIFQLSQGIHTQMLLLKSSCATFLRLPFQDSCIFIVFFSRSLKINCKNCHVYEKAYSIFFFHHCVWAISFHCSVCKVSKIGCRHYYFFFFFIIRWMCTHVKSAGFCAGEKQKETYPEYYNIILYILDDFQFFPHFYLGIVTLTRAAIKTLLLHPVLRFMFLLWTKVRCNEI